MTDSPQKIITDYCAAVRRLYGDEIADKSEIYHEHGWFYVNLAKKFPDGSIGVSGYVADAFRRKKIVEMTEALKKRRTPESQLRTRWRRWLGAKTRWNESEWANLLNANWMCWPTRILDAPPIDIFNTSREQVKKLYLDAINKATMDDLHRLDGIFCEDQLKRR